MDQFSQVVIDQGVKLQCLATTMKLTFDPAVLVGLSSNDLVPLKSDCVGFSNVVKGGQFVFNIPLSNCGASIEVRWFDVSNPA